MTGQERNAARIVLSREHRQVGVFHEQRQSLHASLGQSVIGPALHRVWPLHVTTRRHAHPIRLRIRAFRTQCAADELANSVLDGGLIVASFRFQEPFVDERVDFRVV